VFYDRVSYRGLVHSFELLDSWPVSAKAAAVITADGTTQWAGEIDHEFPLASVSKLIAAYGALVAIEEEAVTLDTPVDVPGATILHLLSHTSGLSFEGEQVHAKPGERRIYSNAGFELLGKTIASRTGIAFADYVKEAVTIPLGMTNTSTDGPAAGMSSTIRDLSLFAAELQNPQLLALQTVAQATAPVFPEVDGVLPGYGVQRPNSWGLGFEIRGTKTPHWTGLSNSEQTFGHFGQSGTFLWVDPEVNAAAVALTNRNFGRWAAELWPDFSDAILQEFHDVA